MLRTLLKTGLLAAVVLAGQTPSIFRKAPPEVDEALRKRVHQFYSLYQDAKFRQAEALVAEESRDLYYGMSKVPIRGFKIEDIEWSDNFQAAKVLVACQHVSPRTAAAGIYVPVTGNWRLVDGQWYLRIETRATTPWGAMKFDDPRAAKAEPFQRPTAETVAIGAFRVEPQKLVFPAEPGAPVTRSIVISNQMLGPLSVEVEDSKLPGLSVTLSEKTIPSRSQVTVEAKYTPEKGKLSGAAAIKIWLQPINQAVTIPVQFE